MARRSYEQACAVARALDALGERWTLLVVRELLLGPRRFSELLQALPGIGPNLLSARLKALTEEGVARRLSLPHPGGAGYELTDDGRALERVVLELARWAVRRGSDQPQGELRGEVRAEWAILALRARFASDSSGDISEVYQLEVGEAVHRLQVDRGKLTASTGRDTTAALLVRADAHTLARLALGAEALEPAEAAGRVQLQGSPFAAARFARAFDLEVGGRA